MILIFLCIRIMVINLEQRKIKIKLVWNHFDLKFILNYNTCLRWHKPRVIQTHSKLIFEVHSFNNYLSVLIIILLRKKKEIWQIVKFYVYSGFEIYKGSILEFCTSLASTCKTKLQIRWRQMAEFRVTSPIVINVQTRYLLAVESRIILFNGWEANFNTKS